jgi:hypothetical protein
MEKRERKIGSLANHKGIVIAMDSRDGMITLTAKEAFGLIGDIRKSLFDWNKLTGRKNDEPACH